MATYQIAAHTNTIVLSHEGMVCADDAINALPEPEGVLLPAFSGSRPQPDPRQAWSGAGSRARRRRSLAFALVH